MNKYLPDLSKLPDGEVKRNIENLAHKFEMLLEDTANGNVGDSDLQKIHTELNETWYKMNTQIGRVFEQQREKENENNKFYISLIISVFALLVSIFALLKS